MIADGGRREPKQGKRSKDSQVPRVKNAINPMGIKSTSLMLGYITLIQESLERRIFIRVRTSYLAPLLRRIRERRLQDGTARPKEVQRLLALRNSNTRMISKRHEKERL